MDDGEGRGFEAIWGFVQSEGLDAVATSSRDRSVVAPRQLRCSEGSHEKSRLTTLSMPTSARKSFGKRRSYTRSSCVTTWANETTTRSLARKATRPTAHRRARSVGRRRHAHAATPPTPSSAPSAPRALGRSHARHPPLAKTWPASMHSTQYAPPTPRPGAHVALLPRS